MRSVGQTMRMKTTCGIRSRHDEARDCLLFFRRLRKRKREVERNTCVDYIPSDMLY